MSGQRPGSTLVDAMVLPTRRGLDFVELALWAYMVEFFCMSRVSALLMEWQGKFLNMAYGMLQS